MIISIPAEQLIPRDIIRERNGDGALTKHIVVSVAPWDPFAGFHTFARASRNMVWVDVSDSHGHKATWVYDIEEIVEVKRGTETDSEG